MNDTTLAVRLNRPDHAWYDIVAPQQPADFLLQTRPRTGRKFTQQLAIDACVYSQKLGDGQYDLPMSDRRANFFGDVQRRLTPNDSFEYARGTSILQEWTHDAKS